MTPDKQAPMTTDYFAELNDKETKRAQKFVNDLKRRIKLIESVELTDQSFKQRAFLQECIEIIVFQSERTDMLNKTLCEDYNWGIDKHTELAKEKLLTMSLIKQLELARTANQFLARLQSKLDGRKLLRTVPTITELYGFATREGYDKMGVVGG